MNKIPYEERLEVYLKAIWKFGTSLQMLVAIEEMSEVIKSITKMERRFHQPHTAEELAECKASIIEEVADATIMLEQLRLIFGINDEVCEAMDAKIERLKERVSG